MAKITPQEVFDEMLPPLRAVAIQIHGLFNGTTGNVLVNRREAGARIESIVEHETVYGPNAVAQLAMFLGVFDHELFQCREVARRYDRNEIIKLAGRRMASGDRLRWEHVRWLAVNTQSSERRRYEELLFANSWRPRELGEAIFEGPTGRIQDLRIDPAHHAAIGFRLEEGEMLHLVDEDGEELVLAIKKLLADEDLSSPGTDSDLAQIAETVDGRFVLCVETPSNQIALELYETLQHLASALWDWDPGDLFTPAAAYILLSAIGAIELKPEFRNTLPFPLKQTS